MRILIDESLPRYIKRMLSGHIASTVQEMGWTGAKNGKLLFGRRSVRCLSYGRQELALSTKLSGKKISYHRIPIESLERCEDASGQT